MRSYLFTLITFDAEETLQHNDYEARSECLFSMILNWKAEVMLIQAVKSMYEVLKRCTLVTSWFRHWGRIVSNSELNHLHSPVRGVLSAGPQWRGWSRWQQECPSPPAAAGSLAYSPDGWSFKRITKTQNYKDYV